MDRLTRRRFVSLGGAGLAAALSGCTGGSGTETEPPNEGRNTATATATTAATPTTAGPDLRYPDLTPVTARICDGVVWHATARDPAMSRIRAMAYAVTGFADDLRAADTVTEDHLAELERRTTALADFLGAQILPHYEVSDVMLNGNNVHVQQIKIASRRGDVDLRNRRLGQLRSLYLNYTRSAFLDQTFTNGPIYAKLYDDVLGDGGSGVFGVFHPPSGFVTVAIDDEKPEEPSDDGVPKHVHEFPSGHVIVAHAHTHGGAHDLGDHENEPATRQLYAYGNGQFDILHDVEPDLQDLTHYEPAVRDVFGAVTVPDRREDVAYLTVNAETGDFVALPLQIQRFDSPATAKETVDFLLSSNVFQEGTEDVGGRPWRRIYYSRDGTNLYAFLLRTGAYVTTVFPEPVPWEQRVDWPGPFERTWITSGS